VRLVEVEGLRIAYERVGSGPPLVLLHGALSDSRSWRPQLEELAEDFTVIAWDAPGAGRSSDPTEPFGMADWADLLARFLETQAVGPASVLGLSFGGTLALELYRRHPKSAAALILADSYAGWRGSLWAAECSERLRLALGDAEIPPTELAARWLPEMLSAGARPELAEMVAGIMADTHPLGLRLMAMAMADADLSELLPRIEVRTLLLWGERDGRSPPSIAREMERAIPGAELVLIPEAGHESHLEQPDAFNTAVRRFCASLPKARAEGGG
jgi:pimeloyl-ACP methyl ester carboxylesterase